MFDIEEALKNLPATPGVYMHKDSLGEIIYVGKAVNLRNRVRQYFRDPAELDPKVRALVSNIAEFDYINCATEMEALVLECNLIKKYMPRYNVLMKDDKTYPFIEVTVTEEFPRVFKTRQPKKDGNRYFGPYSDTGSVNRVINMLHDIYPIKKCKAKSFPDGVRPCLNYFIGKCGGVCIGSAGSGEYGAMIEEVLSILSGKNDEVIASLEKKMYLESELLHYEEAAKYRDYINSIKSLDETQRVSMFRSSDIDILIPLNTQHNKMVVQYRVRDGNMVGRETFMMEGVDADSREIIEAFIKQFYVSSPKLPKEILLIEHLGEEELLTEFLNEINVENAANKSDVFHKTKITIPERGAKKEMLDMAVSDSIDLSERAEKNVRHDLETKQQLRNKIALLIEKSCEKDDIVPCIIEGDERDYRIEAYDISNTNGIDTVGAMVVYEGKKPLKSAYRKFKIKSDVNGDDCAGLQEVIYRRMKRAKAGDEGFDICPDIIFLDGGLGQVHAVKKVLDAMVMPIPVVGLVKDDSHRTRGIVFSDGEEIDLKEDKLLFSYAGNIQEEVHRFAITYHRGVRGSKLNRSILEEIPGIGPVRRKELLSYFKSIDAIKNATYEELVQLPSMNSKAAESVIEFFSQGDGEEKDR